MATTTTMTSTTTTLETKEGCGSDHSSTNCCLASQLPKNLLSFPLSLIQAAIHPEPSVAESPPEPSPSMLLQSLPKDVLVNDVLGFLTNRSVRKFLECLGEDRLRTSFAEVSKHFCGVHGARLEDSSRFAICGGKEDTASTMQQNDRSLACPVCYAESQNTKRCHGCKVFYPRFVLSEDSRLNGISKGGPGLWCQQCDRLAYCNSCLSNDVDGCGNTARMRDSIAAFGRKRLRDSDTNANYCKSARITCHNYCCPNVFTNTMCGEFVCADCGDDHHQQQHRDKDAAAPEHTIETCDECGKATCLDPNCLVCADFRLIHMSCNFRPDYYKLLSSQRSATSEWWRRGLSDVAVGIAVVVCLSKLGWFQSFSPLLPPSP